MSDLIAPLSASARMADPDWPGIVGRLGSDWRLVVSSNGKRYTLQQRVSDDAAPRWASAGGKSPTTLARILAKYSARVEGLAALCAGLPDDPKAFSPGFFSSVRAKDAAFEARDMCRGDYVRAVRRDGQLRLAVDPDGLRYVLQWVRAADSRADRPGLRWRRLFDAPALSDVQVFVLKHVAGIDGPGRAGLIRGGDLLPRWQALVNGLPERAGDGVWPHVPPVPGSPQA